MNRKVISAVFFYISLFICVYAVLIIPLKTINTFLITGDVTILKIIGSLIRLLLAKPIFEFLVGFSKGIAGNCDC